MVKNKNIIKISTPIIDSNEISAVTEVLKSGILSQGSKVKEFEKKFSNFCKTKFAIATSSGTTALHTSLHSIGIKRDDEVITTSFTFVATSNSIIMQGAKPIFADIEEDTFNIDPVSIESKITDKTIAILPVDLYGQICNFKKIKEIANKYGLLILEDACQAIGAESNGKKAGTFGDMGVFSFYATKNITTGEGGMIITNNPLYAKKTQRFINHGQKNKYEYVDFGYNYRMTEIQAAIGIEQLNKIKKITNKRIENAEYLTNKLKDIEGIQAPKILKGSTHVFHQYTIKVANFKITRDELFHYLRKRGIYCGIYYPKPLNLYKFYKKFGYKKGDFPVAEKISKQVLSLPIHPLVSKKDLDYIIKTIKEI